MPSGLQAVCIALSPPMAKGIHPSASASGLFPLWLRRPRFIGSRFSSHSRLWAGARSGLLFGGRKESFPQLRPPPRSFGVRPRTTPILVCTSACAVSLPLRCLVTSTNYGLRPLAMDAHSGNSPEAECTMLAPSPHEDVRTSLPCARARTPFRLLYTRHQLQFFLLVLSFLLSLVRKGILWLMRQRCAEASRLRRW